MSVQYATGVVWDATLFDLELTDASTAPAAMQGLVKYAIKKTTGAPTATAGKFIEGAMIANAVDSQVYLNTGTTASPVWTVMDTAGAGGITALTGDVTASGNGSVAATIANSAVTTAKIADNAVDGTKIALTSQATGDIMYYNGTDWVRLAVGTDGQVLTLAGGLPTWA